MNNFNAVFADTVVNEIVQEPMKGPLSQAFPLWIDIFNDWPDLWVFTQFFESGPAGIKESNCTSRRVSLYVGGNVIYITPGLG